MSAFGSHSVAPMTYLRRDVDLSLNSQLTERWWEEEQATNRGVILSWEDGALNGSFGEN